MKITVSGQSMSKNIHTISLLPKKDNSSHWDVCGNMIYQERKTEVENISTQICRKCEIKS